MRTKLLDREGLDARGIKYSRTHLYRLVLAGRFPKPVKLGARNMWPEHEIDEYLNSLIAERDGEITTETAA